MNNERAFIFNTDRAKRSGVQNACIVHVLIANALLVKKNCGRAMSAVDRIPPNTSKKDLYTLPLCVL